MLLRQNHEQKVYATSKDVLPSVSLLDAPHYAHIPGSYILTKLLGSLVVRPVKIPPATTVMIGSHLFQATIKRPSIRGGSWLCSDSLTWKDLKEGCLTRTTRVIPIKQGAPCCRGQIAGAAIEHARRTEGRDTTMKVVQSRQSESWMLWEDQ